MRLEHCQVLCGPNLICLMADARLLFILRLWANVSMIKISFPSLVNIFFLEYRMTYEMLKTSGSNYVRYDKESLHMVSILYANLFKSYIILHNNLK